MYTLEIPSIHNKTKIDPKIKKIWIIYTKLI